MSDFDVEVVGAPPPRKPESPLAQMLARAGRLLRALLMRPRVVTFIGAAAFLLIVGTPHVGWDYECNHPMRPGHPCQSASYCAYYGIQGRRVVFPDDGESCNVVMFLPPDWKRLL